MSLPDGATWFLRCGACHRLYEPSEAFDMQTGAYYLCWVRPSSQRGHRCDHKGEIQVWNGSAWVVQEVMP